MTARLLLLVGFCCLAPGTVASAATWHVPAQIATIEAALAGAAYGDSIVVAPGIYLESHLIVPSGVVLRGATGDPADVVIDAQQHDDVMMIPQGDETTLVEALTLTGGHAPTGGGLYCGYPTRATIRRCDLVDNVAQFGGGALACFGADPVFESCRFRDNTALADETHAGGAVHLNTADPVFVDCEFSGNETPGNGGAVSVYASAPRFEGCSFTGNQSPAGAAIFVYHAEADLIGCEVTNNLCGGWGPGPVYAYEATVSLADCLISGHTAGVGAGVFGSSHATLVLDGCTIADNTATLGAGGVELMFASMLEASWCTFTDNDSNGVPGDGAVCGDCSALLVCCETGPGFWTGGGEIVFDNEDCVVATEAVSWGDVKARFR